MLTTLERLLVPSVADTCDVWPAGADEDGAARGYGPLGPADLAQLASDPCVRARRGEAGWEPLSVDSEPRTHTLAVAIRGPSLWLVLEREPQRPEFDAAALRTIVAAADLAGQAWESTQLTNRLLESRAAGDAAAHRWAMVGRVSALLARSLDLPETLHDLLGGLVPYLADWAIVDLLDTGGNLHRVAAHAQPELQPVVASLRDFPFIEGRSPAHFAALPQLGIVHRTFDPLAHGYAASREHDTLERLAPRSLVVMPLRVGGRPAR